MNARCALPLLALALVAGGCASSANDTAETTITSAGPVTEPPTTEPPANTVSVTFESEPIEAGPLFGSASSDAAAAEPCIDCDGGGDDDGDDGDAGDGDTVSTGEQAPPEFVPDAVDEPFCTLLADMEDRPFPSDDAEAFVVARAWITELRGVAVASIVDDLDAFLQFLDTAIDSQGQISLDDSTDAIDAASRRMDSYVDEHCFGAGTASTAPVNEADPRPAPDPQLPNGLEIPIIDFTGDAKSKPTPYFGDDLAVGSGGAEQAEAAPFCLAVNVINNRPQPIDDTSEIEVGKAYFDAIAPVVPESLTDEFIVIDAWIDTVLAAGSFDDVEEPEPGDEVSTAVETVNAYVEAQCLTA